MKTLNLDPSFYVNRPHHTRQISTFAIVLLMTCGFINFSVGQLVFCDDCSGATCSDPGIDPNPDLTASCSDLQIIFVIDESGSVVGFENDVRDATINFLSALKCTDAEVAIIEFNTNARYVQSTFTTVDDAFLDGMIDYFDLTGFNGETYDPGSYPTTEYTTNWQDAMMLADALPSSDLLFFFTDGIPNTYNTGTDGTGPTSTCGNFITDDPDIFNPALISNHLKSEGTHVFMLGVAGATVSTLQSMSGTTLYDPNNPAHTIGNTDYSVDDFANVAANITTFANDICPISTTCTAIPICDGATTGGIEVMVDQVASSYDYSYSGPTSGSGSSNTSPFIISNLVAGVYDITVNVVIDNSCTRVETCTSEVLVSSCDVSTTQETCPGANDGIATVSITGGHAPFDYFWEDAFNNPVGSNSATITGLEPGIYYVTVIDNMNCAFSCSGAVAEHPDPEATLGPFNDICLADGSVTLNSASPTGGVFSGPGVTDDANGTTFTFDPTAVGTGTHTITYEVTTTGSPGGTSTIWFEDFEDLPTDIIVDNGPTAWSIYCLAGFSCDLNNGLDHYNTEEGTGAITGTRGIECQDIDGPGVWESEIIDISGYADVMLSLNLEEEGDMEANNDSISVYYSINSGPQIELVRFVDDFTSASPSVNGLIGSSLQIWVYADSDNGGDQLRFDDVLVQGTNPPTAPCDLTVTETITVYELAVSCTGTNVDCNGNSTGSATVMIDAGTGPYVYNWEDEGGNFVGNTSTINNLAAGTYYVTVTANACMDICEYEVTEPIEVTVDATSTNVSCFGLDDGTITVFGLSPGATYTIQLNGVGPDLSAQSNFAPGNYTITAYATDGNGNPNACTASVDITISEPNEVTVDASSTDVTCNGADDGTITVFGLSSGASYIIQLDGIGPDLSAQTNFAPGDYTITASAADGNGNPDICTASVMVTVGEPLSVSCSISINDATCGLSNGSLIVTAMGGNGNYLYSLDGGLNTQASNVFSNLPGGSYTVTVIDPDANQPCASSCDATINETNNLSCSIASTNPTCGNTDGSLIVTVANGSGNFTYTISGGTVPLPYSQANNSFANLGGGTYTITVVDEDAVNTSFCFTTCMITLTEINNLSCSIEVTDPTCGNLDGSLIVTVNNGSGNFAYTISGGSVAGTITNTTGSFTGLGGGSYSVSVVDLDAVNTSTCVTSCTADLVEINDIECDIDVTNATCGNSDGELVVNVTNGSGNFVYTLSGGSLMSPITQASNTFSNLSGGFYSVHVEDQNSTTATDCSTDCTAVIDEINNLSCSIVSSDANCGIANGSLEVTVLNGSGNFEYTLTGGNLINPVVQTSGVFTGLNGGTYFVQVEDLTSTTGCLTSCSASILEINDLECTISVDDANCGVNNGTLTVNVLNGSSNLQYTLTGGSIVGSIVQNNNIFTNLYGGSYSVIVVDLNSTTANPCSTTCTADIDEVNDLECSISVNDEATCGQSNGELEVTVLNGSSNFQYTLTGANLLNPIVQNTNIFTGLPGGTYTVTVLDLNSTTTAQCETSCMATIIEINDLECSIQTTDANCGLANGALVVSVLNGSGNFEYTLSGGNIVGSITQSNNVFSGLVGGNYTVVVEDLNSTTSTICTTTCDAEILEINNLSCSISPTDANCGIANGSLVVTVNNGSGNFEYILTGGDLSMAITQTSNIFTGLAGGDYTVTVIDQNSTTQADCSTTCMATIDEINNLSCTITHFDAACGQATGSLTVNVNNGSGNFDYILTGGSIMGNITQNNNPVFTNLVGGSYTVEVIDLNSTTSATCNTFCSVFIEEINDLSCTIQVTDANCGQATGSLIVNVTNGSGSFQYTLTGGILNSPIIQNSNVFNNLNGGDYTVSVIDLNSTTSATCSTSCTAYIDEINNLSCSISTGDATCGQANGTLNVSVSNGSGDLVYTLDGGNLTSPIVQSSPLFTGLNGGSYTVTVVDIGSTTNVDCSTTCMALIIEVNNLSCSITPNPATCGNENGSLTVNVLNGSNNFEYTLTGGNLTTPIVQTNNNVFSGLAGGSYTVSVVDLNSTTATNCVTSCSTTILEVNDLSCSISPADASCGQANGSLAVSVSNGSGNFQYTLTGGSLISPLIQVNDPFFVGLYGGSYTVSVLDLNSPNPDVCFTTCSTTIDEINDLSCNIIPTSASCGISDGSLEVLVTNGSGNFEYTLTGGNIVGSIVQVNDPVFTGLIGGSYTVSVLDLDSPTSTDCSTTCSTLVGEISDISCEVIPTEATCGNADGSLEVIVFNGSGNFEYTLTSVNLTDPIVQVNNPIFTNLQGGEYFVTVVDLNSTTNNDCSTVCVGYIDEINNIVCLIDATDADCGQANGTLTVTVFNGSGNFEYYLTGGNLTSPVLQVNNPVFTGLAGGDYTVEVVDVSSTSRVDCSSICMATIDEINDLSCTIIPTDATCGLSNGSLEVVVTNGSGNFEFTLTGGNLTNPIVQVNNPIFTGLSGGSYLVNVEDLNSTTITNCETFCTTFINEENNLSCSINVLDATCGLSNGELEVIVLNGSGNFEFTLSGGNIVIPIVQNSNVFTGLIGGNYFVNVIDLSSTTATNCVTSCSAFVDEENNLSCTITPSAADCGLSNGSLEVFVSNGSGNFEYTLTGGNLVNPIVQVNNSIFTGLVGGDYVVNILDLNSSTNSDCSTTCSTFVDEFNNLACLINTSPAGCGVATGSLEVIVSNGSGNFEYTLSGGNLGSPITQVNNPIFTNLNGGNYTILVSDLNSTTASDCSTTCIAFIEEINDLICSISTTDADCGVANGTLSVTVDNGSGNFQYTLSGGNIINPVVQTNDPVFTGLVGGTYIVTVNDLESTTNTDCSTTCFATINEINNITCSISVSDADCGLANGALTVAVVNGSGNFQYTLNGGNIIIPIVQINDPVFNNLAGGSYTVSVLDLNSTTSADCSNTCSAFIDEINNLSCSIVPTNATCGSEDGSLEVIVVNGSGNFEYTLTGGNLINPIVQVNNPVFVGLGGGSYDVSVSDLNSTTNSDCTTSCSTFIDEINDLSCEISTDAADCGQNTGSLTVTVTNGSGNFEYTLTGGNLMNPVVQTSNTFTGLSGGNYSVSVVDLNSTTATDCSTSCTAFIDEINNLSCTLNPSDATCGNADGSLEVIVTNGSGDFIYELTGTNISGSIIQINNPVFADLPGGDYTVEVTDQGSTTAADCSTTCSATITEISNIICDITTTDANCGISNGTLEVTVTNGSGNFEYSLTGGDLTNPVVQVNNPIFTGLVGGDYSVTVVDLNSTTNTDCSASCSAFINEVNNLSCTITTTTANCGVPTGSIEVFVTNGSGNFEYTLTGGGLINPIVQINNPIFSGLYGGNYSINVLDLNSSTATDCSTQCTGFVDEFNDISCALIPVDASCGLPSGSLEVIVTNGSGNFEYTLTGGNLTNPIVQTNDPIFNGLYGGDYSITVLDLDSTTPTDCSASCTTFINEINDISCNIVSTDADCGLANGSLEVSVTNGSGNFEYTLSGGNLVNPLVQINNSIFSGLAGGTYSVNVIDLDSTTPTDCSATCETTIGEINNLSCNIVENQAISCWSGSDGEIEVQMTNGSGNFQYTLSGGNLPNPIVQLNNPIFGGLAVGSYTVVVNDFGATNPDFCSTSCSITLEEPTQLFFCPEVNCDELTGLYAPVYLNISGGTAPYYVSIDNGPLQVVQNDTVMLANGATYLIKVFDDNNCCAYNGCNPDNNPGSANREDGISVEVLCCDIICVADATFDCGDDIAINDWLNSYELIGCQNTSVVNSYTVGGFSGGCGMTGSQLVIFEVIDIDGIVLSECSAILTIIDTIAPTPPQAPADLDLQCADDVPDPIDLTASDECDGDITVSPSEDIIPGTCDNDFVLIRTWTFIDNCGNASSVSQTITVIDDIAPIAPSAPADEQYQCEEDIPQPEPLTAVDNCDGDIVALATDAQ